MFDWMHWQTWKSPKWGPADKLGLLLIVGVAMWFAFPTGFFIRIKTYDVYGQSIVLQRTTLLDRLPADVYMDIFVPQTGRECTQGHWRAVSYQHKDDNSPIEVPLGQWAEPCIANAKRYDLFVARKGYLFGAIPLRTDQAVYKIECGGVCADVVRPD